MKKIIYIFIALVGVLICSIMYVSSRSHPFEWNIKRADAKGQQPYDMAVFDSLMLLSLPNGYSVKSLTPQKGSEPDEYGYRKEQLLFAADSIDAKKYSLLIVQRYEWNDSSNKDIGILGTAFKYADRGGKVLFICGQSLNNIKYLKDVTTALGSHYDLHYEPMGDFAPNNLITQDDRLLKLIANNGRKIKVNNRFCYTYFYPCNDVYDKVENYDGGASYDKVENYDYSQGDSCFEADSEVYDDDKVSEKSPFVSRSDLFPKSINNYTMKIDLQDASDISSAKSFYELEFVNKSTGGKIVFNVLPLYYSNLGVTLPEGKDLIEYSVSKIDSKHIVRLDYPYYVNMNFNGSNSSKSSMETMLDELEKSPALYFAWLLVLLVIVLALACGFYRRLPANKSAHFMDVDRTDPVAVREAKFRLSPLLHFIFQYSWLYKGSKNYNELFLINYRQFARYVNRKSGVELTSANEEELRRAAGTLSMRTGFDKNEIAEDLLTMQNLKATADLVSTISVKDYMRSQTILEKY